MIVLSQFVPEENSAAAEVESEPVMISSENIRLDLLIHTWHCFIESKGMGVGIGNTAQLAKPTAAKRDNIWAIHCFIARMAADFGIWFLIPFAIIAFKLLQFGMGYVLQEKKKGDWQSVMTGVLYLAAVFIYPIASTAAGDAQNCVPMWLFLGVIMLFPTMIQESD